MNNPRQNRKKDFMASPRPKQNIKGRFILCLRNFFFLGSDSASIIIVEYISQAFV